MAPDVTTTARASDEKVRDDEDLTVEVVDDSDARPKGSKFVASRRTILLAGTAVALAACDPIPGGNDGASDAPESLAFDPADVELVEDEDGNTAADNEGVLELSADVVGEGDPSQETTTTAPGSNRAPQSTTTPPATSKPSTNDGGTKASSPTSAPATTATTAPSTTAPPTTAASTSTSAGAGPLTTGRRPTTTAGGVSTTATTVAPTTSTTLPPPPPVASPRHATSRLTFGITPAVDLAVITMGVEGWIEDQLSRTTPDPAVEAQLRAAGFNSLDNTTGQNRQQYIDDLNMLRREVTHSNFFRARYSENQLYEMMCQLWMDHLNISFQDGAAVFLPEYQETVIRPNAMGSFIGLLTASANSGGMMRYLDNYRSDARSGINENYGREILELHSLGIDRNGNQIYTELDVVGAANVFSGWSIDPSGNSPTYGSFVYRPEYHSTDPVSLLGGQWSNAGLNGKAAGDSLVQFLARHPQTANYVCWKLCRRFVSDNPSEQLIAGAAQVYLNNDTAIVPVLRYIFSSREFVESEGDKVRRPFELMCGALRAMDTDVPVESEGDGANQIRNQIRSLGHEPWQWETPDGYPDEGQPWINSNSLLRQWNFTGRLARNNIGGSNEPNRLTTDVSRLRGSAVNGRDLFDRVAFHCNLGALPDDLRSSLLSICGFDDGTPAASVTDDQLAELCTYLLAHPLFLLR